MYLVFLLAAITAVLSGCSRNNEIITAADDDTSKQVTVNTEGFSFVHTGPIPKTFSESPELTKLVAAGTLPPIEERLPEEPMIVPVIERIGQYGGTWRRGFMGPFDRQSIDRILHDHLIYYDIDGQTLVPHIAKGWEINEDGTVFTFHLRKGMKWSDGVPFTADDFVFAYEEITANDNINLNKPSYLKAEGQLCRMKKIDDYTVEYSFPIPNFVFIENVASLAAGGQSFRRWEGPLFAPRHYLRQFLPQYADADELERKVKAAGLKNWRQLFQRMCSVPENPDLPVVGPWKTVSPISSELFSLERNPYYFAIDPEGNQLPYIDKIEMYLVENMEVFNTRVIAGEVDMQHRHVQISKLPALIKESKNGDYRILYWPAMGGSEAAIFFNQTWEGDPEIEKWLRNRDFRIALSLSIDREEILESIFLGEGEPRPFIALPNNPYYPGSEYEKKYAQRDLVKANALLDQIGLERKNKEGYRLRTDSDSPLTIYLGVPSRMFLDFEGIAELAVIHFKEVGIKLQLKIEERSLFSIRRAKNEHHLLIWGAGGSENPWIYPDIPIPTKSGSMFATLVGSWYESEGRNGIQPYGNFKRLLDIFEQGNRVPKNRRIELGKEIWRIHADNVYAIGIVGNSPAWNGIVVVKNSFRNVPDVAPNSAALQNPGIARTEQFFFER
jgi:peptide/nickel transport system substrate-binding protein